MMQLIQITEEKLTETILAGVKKELEQLKKDFQRPQQLKWVPRKEVARMLSVSYTTLYSWQRKGVLNAYSIGNRVYYKLEEVNNALTPIAC